MRLSRVATMIVGAALGSFAAVWWMRRRWMPAAQVETEIASSDWIELK